MAGKIFISYRREDEAAFAVRLYERLSESFGKDRLFFDIDSIPPGFDFVKYIEEQIDLSTIVLVVIGRNWLESIDAHGRRRLDNPEDFVRVEVESALKKGKHVVPLLVEGAPMPLSTQLPKKMQQLARRNAFFANHGGSKAETTRLVAALEAALVPSPRVTPSVAAPRPTEEDSAPPARPRDHFSPATAAVVPVPGPKAPTPAAVIPVREDAPTPPLSHPPERERPAAWKRPSNVVGFGLVLAGLVILTLGMGGWLTAVPKLPAESEKAEVEKPNLPTYATLADLGLTLRDIADVSSYGLAGAGVYVVSVAPGSPADLGGVRSAMLLVSVAANSIRTTQKAEQWYQTALAQGTRQIRFSFRDVNSRVFWIDLPNR